MKSISPNKKLFNKVFIGVGIYLICMTAAYAGGGVGAGLPWEAPLDKIVKSLTGPVAMGISMLAMVATGGMLIFGGELGEFTKKLIMIVLGVSFLVFGGGILQTVFGISGCII